MIEFTANNLCIGYRNKNGNSVVAEDINFSGVAGQLMAIVGVNGIGKTTLLRTLAGIQPALGGTILLDSKQIAEYSARDLSQRMSIVLTEPLPTKNLSVLELVSLGRQPYTNWIGGLTKEDLEVVAHILTRLNIRHLQKKKCYELSDGQLQKVMLARALSQDTAVILLDEPTTHLDLYHKVQILKLLREIAHDLNKLVLFSTHEIELAIQLSDALCVLHDSGSAFGTPGELIQAGEFNKLFPQDTLRFDPETGSFSVFSE